MRYYLALFLLLAGCSTSMPPRLYTLQSLTFPDQGTVSAQKSSTILSVAVVEVPDYLDQPQIVTRGTGNQLKIHELDLWGGSFKTDVNRVLVEDLSSLLAPRVAVAFYRASHSTTYKLPVVITRFDAVPGDKVILKARWLLATKDYQGPMHETEVKVPLPGTDTPSVVAVMSEALKELSKGIAGELKGELERLGRTEGKSGT